MTCPETFERYYGEPFVWAVTLQSGGVNMPRDPHLVFEIINAFRAVHGSQPMQWNDQLAAAALKHSEDMQTNNFLGHTGYK
jgi:hypothetical protein